MKQSNDNILGTAPIGKLLVKYSVPAIIGMLVNMLYNVVDRIYIGQIPNVGGLAITGVGITMPITNIITGIGMLVGIGTSASISLALGKGDKRKAEKTLNNGFLLIVIASLLVATLGTLLAPSIVHLFGGSDRTTPFALLYLRPLLIGTICNLCAFGLNHSISSDGSPKVGMFTMIIGATVNIILDPILIFGLDMGIQGAAVATVASQLVAACWVLFYFTKGKKSSIKIKLSELHLHNQTTKGILMIGLAPFCMQLAGSLVQVVSNKALFASGGDMAIGAMAVITSICSIFIIPIFGLNQGAQPIIGFNYGSGRYNRAKKTYLVGLFWCTIILLISTLVIQLIPETLIKMFNNDPELTEIALNGIRVYLIALPIIGVQMATSNYFQAVGKPMKAMIIGLTRQVIFLIPAFIIFSRLWGIKGVWIAGPICDSLAACLSLGVIIHEFKLLDNKSIPDHEV
ncbi:MATE family efflux transporter [Anaerosporobacter sp.]|uniref:MATE family efflux transporter n=1 Tax=Anaerosporobacter sp. TaxID=1872529 RepID=UPI00289E7DDF|nr:MATE family efflux transporter [Anaerosporobacter sp.]